MPGQCHLRHDGREAERRDGEIEGAEPQRRQTDNQAEDCAHYRRDRECQIGRQRRQHVAGREHTRRVGAERQQGDPADSDLAGEPDHEIEARHQHPIDAGPRCDHAPIAAAEQRKREADDKQRQERQRRADETWPRGRMRAGSAHIRDLL